MPEYMVTVVTVCRNAAGTIRDTIESVLHQSFKDFEYLVVDGASTDNTVAIAAEYDSAFSRSGIAYRLVSEPDKGIFDAMNKAADLAKGEWICFMNADDKFHDADVLRNVFDNEKVGSLEDYDVVYGDTVRISGGQGVFGQARPIEDIVLNMPFCHQSSFTRTDRLRNNPFDLNYRVADYSFFLRLYRNHGRFLRVPITIADYSLNGYSNQNKYMTYLGTVQIKHDLGMLNQNRPKQHLKNKYFKALLIDNHPLHRLVRFIDERVSRRKH